MEKYISMCSLPGVVLLYSESWVPMKYWGVSEFAQCEVFIQIPRLATRMKKSPKLPPRQFFFNSSYLHLECMLSILDIFICLCIGDIHRTYRAATTVREIFLYRQKILSKRILYFKSYINMLGIHERRLVKWNYFNILTWNNEEDEFECQIVDESSPHPVL